MFDSDWPRIQEISLKNHCDKVIPKRGATAEQINYRLLNDETGCFIFISEWENIIAANSQRLLFAIDLKKYVSLFVFLCRKVHSLFWKSLSDRDLIYDLSILFAFPSLQVGEEKCFKEFGFFFFITHHNSYSFNQGSSFHTFSGLLHWQKENIDLSW